MFLGVGDGRGIWCIQRVCLYLAGHTSVPPCLGGVVVRGRVGHVVSAGVPVLEMGQEPRSIMRCALYVRDGSEGRCQLDCPECAPWCGWVVGSGMPVLCRYRCDRLAPRLVVPRGPGTGGRRWRCVCMWSRSGGSSPSGICSASWLWACKSMCSLPRLYRLYSFDEMQDDVFGEAPQGCPEV